jgi:hypothetical protein
MNWYKPNKNFKISDLNKIEVLNIDKIVKLENYLNKLDEH